MKGPMLAFVVVLAASTALGPLQAGAQTPTVAPANAPSRAVVPPNGEPGTPIVISGIVSDAGGSPLRGASVYVYQTDARGYYDPSNPRLGMRGADSSLFMFGFYIWNNVRIGFQTFAGGLLAGVGSVWFLASNGVIIGRRCPAVPRSSGSPPSLHRRPVATQPLNIRHHAATAMRAIHLATSFPAWRGRGRRPHHRGSGRIGASGDK